MPGMAALLNKATEIDMAKQVKPIRNWDQLLKDAHFCLGELKKNSRCSARQLAREIKADFDLSLQEFLDHKRVQAVEKRLPLPRPIKMSGLEIGLKHPQSFWSFCMKHFGMSPEEFRRRNSK